MGLEKNAVTSWVMWVTHIVFLIAFFPALAITIPAHIYLHVNGCLR